MNSPLLATLPAADIDRAKAWYRTHLGLEPAQVMGDGSAIYETGGVQFMLYPSQFAGTNQATAAGFMVDDFDAAGIAGWFDELDAEKVVVKPGIGANAQDTFVLTRPVSAGQVEELQQTFAGRAFFVQPFMANIQTEGEYSLFFFNDEYSHAILKTPEQGDFRSQEEHGAAIEPVVASEQLVAAARKLLALVEPQPTYVRVDLVRDERDDYRLMELELIEPSLYLRTDPGSAARFAAAFDATVRSIADDR